MILENIVVEILKFSKDKCVIDANVLTNLKFIYQNVHELHDFRLTIKYQAAKQTYNTVFYLHK